MSTGPDLSRAVQFDLARGAVSVQAEPSMLVPASALGTLLAAVSPEQRARVGGELGAQMGARVEARAGVVEVREVL